MVRRLIILAVAVVCLTSCAAAGSVGIERSTKEYETDYSAVKAEVIAFTGMEDNEFEASVNDSIAKETESAIVGFDTDAAQSAENVRMGNKCVFENIWQEKYNKNNFVSMVEERYVYLGGAHGQTVRMPLNIDTLANKEVKLADLFEDEGYVTTLNRMINKIISEDSEEYGDLWEKPEIKESNQTDFYIEDDELVIFYQPYDLSYYARGFVEFEFDLEDLSGYLKEEYRRLI